MTKFDPAPHVIKLQGKDYLPVAARIAWMRSEHPDWSIVTAPVNIGQAVYMSATVSDNGSILATAHKAINANRKGPGASYPLEAAETGAIGRALGLCGYGTLSGDLDEGEELADSPQPVATPHPAPPCSPDEVAVILAEIEAAQSLEDLETPRKAANAAMRRMTADEKATVRDALAYAKAAMTPNN